MTRGHIGASLSMLAILLAAPAMAETTAPAALAEGPKAGMLGIGYKYGNGIGFVGADMIVNALPNLSLDLQASSAEGAFGLAPSVQWRLNPAGGPYIGVGLQRATATAGSTTVAINGYFANIGFNQMLMDHVEYMYGLGYQFMPEQTSSGVSVPTSGGLNLEAGIRFYAF